MILPFIICLTDLCGLYDRKTVHVFLYGFESSGLDVAEPDPSSGLFMLCLRQSINIFCMQHADLIL